MTTDPGTPDNSIAAEPPADWIASRLSDWPTFADAGFGPSTQSTAQVARKPRRRHRQRDRSGLARDEARTSPLFVGHDVWSSIHKSPHTLVSTAYIWDKKALGAYTAFKKLLGERKFAGDYPVQTVSFSDLPGEIRNRILADALFVGSIDLAAKSGRMGRINQVRSNHHRDLVLKVKPNLGLLRLNKQINTEASQIFYGLNEFRFTGRCGHDILRAFCNTIGKRNTLLLTKIAEHVPWVGNSGELCDRPARSSKTCWSNFQDMLTRRGCHQNGRWTGKSSVERTLARSDSLLLQYRLILACDFELASVNWSDEAHPRDDLTSCFEHHETDSLLPELEAQKDSSRVKITLVMLEHEEVAPGFPRYEARGRQVVMRQKAMELALSNGWAIENAMLSDKGYYTYSKAKDGAFLELGPGDEGPTSDDP